MARSARSVVADQIRIEDEVWDEAFASRVRSRPPRGDVTPAPARVPAPVQALADPLSGLAEDLYSASTSLFAQPRAADPDAPDPFRRTVRIQGRGAERNLPVSSSRRRSRAPYEPVRFRPDRVAMWAVMLGLLLVLAAMLSAHS